MFSVESFKAFFDIHSGKEWFNNMIKDITTSSPFIPKSNVIGICSNFDFSTVESVKNNNDVVLEEKEPVVDTPYNEESEKFVEFCIEYFKLLAKITKEQTLHKDLSSYSTSVNSDPSSQLDMKVQELKKEREELIAGIKKDREDNEPLPIEDDRAFEQVPLRQDPEIENKLKLLMYIRTLIAKKSDFPPVGEDVDVFLKEKAEKVFDSQVTVGA